MRHLTSQHNQCSIFKENEIRNECFCFETQRKSDWRVRSDKHNTHTFHQNDELNLVFPFLIFLATMPILSTLPLVDHGQLLMLTRVATKFFEGFGEVLFKEFIVGQELVSTVHYTRPWSCINHSLH